MISNIGDSNAAAGLPERIDARKRQQAPPSQPEGDRAGLGYAALGILHGALPPSLQEALHRAIQAASDAGGEALTAVVDAVQRPDAWEAVDRALNLTGGGAGALLTTLGEMSREDAETALKALAELLRRGVVGYEYREINGAPQKVFIDVAMGSDLHRAPLVRGAQFDGLF